jgi:hypothetical protein
LFQWTLSPFVLKSMSPLKLSAINGLANAIPWMAEARRTVGNPRCRNSCHGAFVVPQDGEDFTGGVSSVHESRDIVPLKSKTRTPSSFGIGASHDDAANTVRASDIPLCHRCSIEDRLKS